MRRDGYVKWADAFILLYSITDTQSYHTVRGLRDTISELKKFGSSVALVANKSDLSHMRQVSASSAHVVTMISLITSRDADSF